MLASHHQRVDGEGALALRQHDHWIQIEFGDAVAKVVGELGKPCGHVGEGVDIGGRGAANAGKHFRAFQTF
jgi:hypothetical protein